MKSFLKAFFARRRWEYVGRVQGVTNLVDDYKKIRGGTIFTYWLLYERGTGKRKFETLGKDRDLSAFALSRKAEVIAWVRGGPYPESAVMGGGD